MRTIPDTAKDGSYIVFVSVGMLFPRSPQAIPPHSYTFREFGKVFVPKDAITNPFADIAIYVPLLELADPVISASVPKRAA